MPKRALEHVRRMRGGAQAHLLRSQDGAYYVTKFQNNPQHLRILANEMLCGLLAQALGLPVARPAPAQRPTFFPDNARPNSCLANDRSAGGGRFHTGSV